VLGRCVELEKHAGRRRVRFWGDRPLDLDLLLDGDRIVRTPDLILPHPAIGRRPFVLEPLLEVWPDAVDPTTGTAYAALPRARGPRPIPDGLLARGRRLRFV
jgi:2-amino-4-hydroxy-6-hydroxymethyldihydropteridine diphosphokinase